MLLRFSELSVLERQYPHGVPAHVIVDAFQSAGARFSDATFRKYIQVGLLPRSRRVGQKGKHRGSRGLYPVEALRQINVIKRMMDAGLTLDEIKNSFVVIGNHLDQVDRELTAAFSRIEARLASAPASQRRRLARLRAAGQTLIAQTKRLGERATARATPPHRKQRGSPSTKRKEMRSDERRT